MTGYESAFVKLVNEARARIKEVDVAELRLMQEKSLSFHLLDVREESEWAQGGIQGAVHISKGVIERDIEQIVPHKNETVILYCGGGYRSALAADNLQKMGYTQVASLVGGYRAWISSVNFRFMCNNSF